MLIRIVVFVMMALGLVGFGTVAWLSLQPPRAAASANGGAAPKPQVAVLIAAHDLPAGSLLKSDDIGSESISADKEPDGASLDSQVTRRALAGSMIRRRLGAGEMLLPPDLLRPGDHGFLAAVLGSGMRAVTVGVDAISGTAGLIWPGDHVDVLLTHQIDDTSRPIGRRVAAETVLTNVRVIAIDQQLVEGAAPGTENAKPATTVTLEVTSQDAERVSVATRLGRLSLVVRSAKAGTAAENASPGITWASDVSPALDAVNPTARPSVVHVFSGNGGGQEYRF
jgi:pilus assembly protein CpaB